MTIKRSSTQTRALKLLQRGLITHSEAAAYTEVTRQAVRQMCARAGIDAPLARYRHLQRLFAERGTGAKKEAE
jgi:hypothetical protein